MKRYISLFFLLFSFTSLLSGCGLSAIRSGLEEANTWFDRDQNFDTVSILQYISDNWDAINLAWLELESIPDLCALIPQELQQWIKAVNLSRNDIETVDADLSCFENLLGVDLSFNSISELVWLWYLPMLRDLWLSQNKIEDLSSEFFSTFPWLEWLRLSYNKIKDISALSSVTSLLNLELQHNDLTSLLWLENLERIEKLRLEFNELKEDQLTYLNNLDQLKDISWWYNKFKEEILLRRKDATN